MLAGGVALSSHVIATEVRAPAKSCATQVPLSRGGCANLAAASYAARRLKDPETGVLKQERQLALRGYRAEPLSASALSILSLPVKGQAKGGDQQALLELAGKVTRRNTLINAQAIEAAGRRDDKQAFFRWLSRSMLTNNEARKSYIGVMARATSMPGAVEALAPVIGAGPNWAPDYWRNVVQFPPGLANAAELRIAITRPPWRRTSIGEMDERLVLGLVQYGQFDEALALADRLAPANWRDKAGANRLINGRFAAQPHFAPLDWELAATGNLGASIEPAKKRVLISAIGGAQGMTMRQLVRLSPGTYALRWTLSDNPEMQKDALRFRIFCAEVGGGAPSVIVPALVGAQQATVRIANEKCEWRWLSLDIFLPDDAAGVDVYLSDVSLTPVREAPLKSDAVISSRLADQI
jgi:hypothetical protein